MTSSKTDIAFSDWKVFLDGVEVPHQGFNISFTQNQPSTATIVLEPDRVLANLRPQTVVHIFVRDNYPEDDNLLLGTEDLRQRFHLYWEGLVRGHRHEKSPESRSFLIECEALLGIFSRTRGFMTGIGAITYSPIISGSTQINPDFGNGDLFSLTLLTSLIDATPGVGEDIPFRDNVDPQFSDLLIRLVSTLSSFNAALRQQVVRYRFLDKICSVPDATLTRLLQTSAVLELMTNASTVLGEQSSILDMIHHVQSYGFYSHYECPLPFRPEDTKRKEYPFSNTFDQLDNVDDYRIPDLSPRNDLMVLPETYFYLPPPCNFIFPDNVSNLSVTRNYYGEPTRYLVADPFMSKIGLSAQFYLSPPDILRSLSEKERASNRGTELFGFLTQFATKDDENSVSSGYQASGTNLLNVLTDSELEKGIVAIVEQYTFESASAWAKNGSTVPDTDKGREVYNNFMSQVADFKYQMMKYNRSASVQLTGHRYMVPGFPAVIFQTDVSYLGKVVSLSFNVDPQGAETTSVVLDKVRPIKRISLGDIQKELSIIQGIAQAAASAEKAVSEDTEEKEKAELLKVRTDANQLFEHTLAEFAEKFDIPVPPSFLSVNFSDMEALDSLYTGLLGCRPFYSTAYGTDTAVQPDNQKTVTDSIGDILQERLDELLTYIQGLQAINNVFPIFEDRITDQTSVGNSNVPYKSWSDIGQDTGIGQSPRDWEITTFQRRQGTTMRQFLQDNNLRLEEYTSDMPSPTQFWLLKPTDRVVPKGASNALIWDNSIFSKLVDERVLAGKSPDKLVEEARAQVTDPGLTSAQRQQDILNYSRRHFGGRAYGGY